VVTAVHDARPTHKIAPQHNKRIINFCLWKTPRTTQNVPVNGKMKIQALALVEIRRREIETRRRHPRSLLRYLWGRKEADSLPLSGWHWTVSSQHLFVQRSLGFLHGLEDQMSKSTRNSGKAWGSTETKELKSLADKNTPTRVIGLKLGRTEDAVRSKASDLGVSLKPTNQSPYNRKK
jgi:hypothetical protein